ncbi:monocarboxylate transporter 13-like [Branchiostoma floridae]|uniref:Monocarboxylate transporter 13-like n=1 Tax=Branchiostoma floridae TaxID=7739 RepID=A0A9J7KMB9_BRAFL|nr:monocarboxylate transporter 13-like [Branchiostoma floridae]
MEYIPATVYKQTVFMFPGLVSSILCRRFGARPLVMIGGVVGAVGLLLTSFSTSIVHLHLSLGLTSGLGFALVYNPTFIIVGQYFHEKRHLAYAMMVTGTGVGGFIFSPVFQLLIDEYGWRGAIIVQAGVTLHLCVAAALMRPLHVPPARGPSQTYISQDSLSSAATSHPAYSNHHDTTRTTYLAAPLEEYEDITDISQDQEPTVPGAPVPHVRRERQRGFSECSIGAVSLRLLEPASSQESLPRIPEMTDDDTTHKLESVSVRAVRPARSSMSLSRRMLYSSQRMLDVLSRSETLLSLSSQLTYETTIHTKLAGKPGLSIHSIVTTLFDLSLIKSVPFVLLSISFFLFHLGYLVPGIGVVPRAQHAGIEETQVSFLPSIISISDLVGRLLSGGLSKIPGCTRTFQFITLNVIIAAGAVVFPVTETYSGMAAYAVWHGLANGLCYPLIPTLVVDVAGVEKIASAMGMVMFITSIGLTVGLPTAGILYDTTGSYDASFYFVGACFLLSAAVLAFSHILSIRRQDSVPEES